MSELHHLWPRVSGFLSTLAPRSQSTYAQAISEFLEYLHLTPGTLESAKSLTEVTALQAQAFVLYLRQRPGLIPRADIWVPPDAELISTLTPAPGPKHNLIPRPELFPTVATSTYLTPNDGSSSRLSNATLSKKLTILRRLYRLLTDLGFCAINPFNVHDCPPPDRNSGRKRVTEGLSTEEVALLLSQPNRTTSAGIRDYAILCLLFGCGLRRSELTRLRLSDVRTSKKGTPYLLLRSTKSGKDAEQAIPPFAHTALSTHLERRIYLEKATEIDPIFPLTNESIRLIFKRYTKRACLSSYLTPHSARATAITQLLDRGVTHRDVQVFSRHSSVSMVEVYDKRRVTVDESPALSISYEKPTTKVA